MSDAISQARQKLRDLARMQIETTRTINFKGMEDPVEYTFVLGKLGEVAGPLFMAVQEVLRVAEELREEASLPDTETGSRDEPWQIAKRATADRIEAAIFLALG